RSVVRPAAAPRAAAPRIHRRGIRPQHRESPGALARGPRGVHHPPHPRRRLRPTTQLRRAGHGKQQTRPPDLYFAGRRAGCRWPAGVSLVAGRRGAGRHAGAVPALSRRGAGVPWICHRHHHARPVHERPALTRPLDDHRRDRRAGSGGARRLRFGGDASDPGSGHRLAARQAARHMSGAPRIVRELTSALHAARLSYRHWKGNARLQEAVVGLRDLDILVDRDGALALSEILATVGFKRLASSPWETVPALEDYLALDSDTGRLVHLHLHYRLTVGDSFLSGYRLPWEALVLSTRHFDTTMAMYVADPHIELVLLIARQAIRLGPIDRIAAWLGRPCLGALARSDFRLLAAWLTWKLDVLVLHGGGGDGRRATWRKAFRARSRGMIVLYDGCPEGPSLDTGNAPERAWDADPPDLVINLQRAPRPDALTSEG